MKKIMLGTSDVCSTICLYVCMYVCMSRVFSVLFLHYTSWKYIYLITTSLFLTNDLYFILRLPSFSFRHFPSDLRILGTSVLRLFRFLTIIISIGALEFLRQKIIFTYRITSYRLHPTFTPFPSDQLNCFSIGFVVVLRCLWLRESISFSFRFARVGFILYNID